MATETLFSPTERSIELPTYLYICENGHEYEEARGMTEEQRVSICIWEGCGSRLSRKFTAPTINFKGTGFNTSKG